MRIKDPEARRILAATHIEGVLTLMNGKLTQSIHVDSYGNESEKITIEYPKTTE